MREKEERKKVGREELGIVGGIMRAVFRSHEPRLSRDTYPEFGSNLFRCIFVSNVSRFVRSLLPLLLERNVGMWMISS